MARNQAWKPPKRPSDLSGHHILEDQKFSAKFLESDGPVQYLALLHDKKIESAEHQRALLRRQQEARYIAANTAVVKPVVQNTNTEPSFDLEKKLESALGTFFDTLKQNAAFKVLFSYKTLAVLPALLVVFGIYKITSDLMQKEDRTPASATAKPVEKVETSTQTSTPTTTAPTPSPSPATENARKEETIQEIRSELGSGKNKVDRVTGSVTEIHTDSSNQNAQQAQAEQEEINQSSSQMGGSVPIENNDNRVPVVTNEPAPYQNAVNAAQETPYPHNPEVTANPYPENQPPPQQWNTNVGQAPMPMNADGSQAAPTNFVNPQQPQEIPPDMQGQGTTNF